MVKACRKASKNLIRDFGEVEKLQVSLKGPGNFVTASDKKTEKILIEELQTARPNYSFLSEEIGEIKNDSEFRWINANQLKEFNTVVENPGSYPDPANLKKISSGSKAIFELPARGKAFFLLMSFFA